MKSSPKEQLISELTKPRRWYWMPLIVFVLGVSSIILITWTKNIHQRILLHNYPRADAIMELQIKVSQSHLWLLEYIEGAHDIELNEKVFDPLGRADRLIGAFLNGGESDLHGREIYPLTNHEMRARTEEVKSLLTRFKTTVSGWYKKGKLDSDEHYIHDEVFQEIIQKTHLLDLEIGKEIVRENSRVRLLFIITILAWSVIVVIAVMGLITRERRHKQAEDDAEWTLQTLQKLDRLQEYLLGPGVFEDKLKKITDGVVRIFNADFCRIWLIKPGDLCDAGCAQAEITEGPHVCCTRDSCLHLVASSGRYVHIDGKTHRRMPIGCYKVGNLAVGEENKLISNDIVHDPLIQDPDWAEELGLVSFAGYRLLSEAGETLGVLALFAKHAITFKEDAMLEGLADTAAQVVQHAYVEEELAEERERLAVTLRSIGDGVISTDTKGHVAMLNKKAENLTGWSQQEAYGKPLMEIFHIVNEKTNIECENPVERVIKTGKVVGLANHTALIARDGTRRIIADSGAPIRDRESKIIGVVLVFRDITQKHKMEEDIQRSQKLESIGVLAGGIAHDFNNILTAILGNVSLAKISVEPDEEIYNYLTDAEKATLRARDLTQQLLTFSKGGVPIIRPVSIAGLLKDSVSFALTGSKVSCEYKIPFDVWSVKIDQGQIGQVINNLTINADQAMPEGGNIEVSCENIAIGLNDTQLPLKAGKYVKIAIKDQGHSIPKEHIEKIFDPYFTTKQKGSGLGLTTAYSIIKKHDGHIDVESGKGRGTTFYIYLPASAEKIPPEVEIEEKHLPHTGRILVMDDDERVRDVIMNMLSQLGFEVNTVSDGEEALEFYKNAKESGESYDVVIMDLTIPGGMGGKETIKRLLEVDPEAKAIVSSGYSTDPIMADFKKYGFCGFAAKPYNFQELSQVLRKIIK